MAKTMKWDSGFFYHFFVGARYTMTSSSLPVLLHVAVSQGYNPAAVGMLWTFSGGGKLFVYQATNLIFG